MTRLIRAIRGRLGRRLGVVFSVAGILVTLGAAPASATTFYDSYFNPFNGGKYEGNYSWIDCGTCSDDHVVTVSNVRNGYHVRVRMQADVYRNGVYYTYLDKILNDGYSAKWWVTDTMPNGPIRLSLCFYNSSWTYIGGCQYHYGWHSK
jgi:hypothetical protein